MASEYLGVPEDIDDRITEFVRDRRGVTVEMVLRDTLSYLFGEPLSVAEMIETVDRTIIRPILAPAR